MLRDLLAWWVRQMRDLFGGRPGGAAAPARRAMIIEARETEPDSVTLTRRQNRRETRIGQYRLDKSGMALMRRAVSGGGRKASVILRLPADLLLELEVTLPLLAEREPARALSYEMDRLTPFTPAEVFWTWSMERRDRAAGRLHLRLTMVSRQMIQPILAALERAALVPTLLEAPGADGFARTIAMRHAAPAKGHRLLVGGAICCAMLGVVAIVQPFMLQSAALSQTARRIAELRTTVTQVEALRRRIAGETAGTDVIAAEHERVGDAVTVLATVTEILPDSAFLTAFTMAQRKLTLVGRAGSAARLITALAADPTLRNPTFAAPVTRDAHGRADLFSIQAELIP